MKIVCCVLGVMVMAAVGRAQRAPAAQALSFDVTSIKQNTTVDQEGYIRPGPNRFIVLNTPLRFVLMYAFGIRDHQLIGTPEWAASTPYDITATYPAGSMPSEDNVRMMTRQMLAERFALQAHHEERQLPLYTLVRARPDALGPRLTPSSVNCEEWRAQRQAQAAAGSPIVAPPPGSAPMCTMFATRTFIRGGTRTIAQLVSVLQSMVQRPVIDRTGLTGTFDIDLQWGTGGDVRAPIELASPAETASIFTAVQEQLGLKLDAGRGPFDVVVIDSIQRPTAN